MSWRDRSVLVTGGNGFLGSHVVRSLVEAGARVTCLLKEDRPLSCFHLEGLSARVTCARGVVEDHDLVYSILRECRVDAVLHLAAQPIVGEAAADPLPTLESNVRGTYCVLEAARRWGGARSVVVVTSDKVYGEPERLPIAEGDRLGGLAPYEASKVCADVLAQCYARGFGLPVGISRLGNLYGPGDAQWSRVVPGTIRSLLAGERPVVRSDGTPVRDYFYVEDAAEALLLFGEALALRPEVRGEALNFGTGVATAAIDVVRALVERSGRRIDPVVLGGGRGEISAQVLDCTKAERVIGWRARTELAGGLDRAWAWYERVLA